MDAPTTLSTNLPSTIPDGSVSATVPEEPMSTTSIPAADRVTQPPATQSAPEGADSAQQHEGSSGGDAQAQLLCNQQQEQLRLRTDSQAADQAQRQRQPGPQQQDAKSKPKSKSRNTPRLAKLDDPDEVDELLDGGMYDNEEQLVAKLMQQLQGLSHKQQRLYGIWDGISSEGGKRAFLDQWRRRHTDRRAMAAALKDPSRPPQERMSLRSSYILKWRKVLFSCPHCWLLPGLCVCGRMQRFAPQRTKVVVHAHHGEWGSASNSGSILPTSLEGSEILLYGHADHDQRLRDMLADTTRTTALLWPGADSLLPEQLSAIAAERTGGRITVVALDATWGNARRMQGWFPKGTLTVRLPPESTLKENKLSLLRPVRKYRGDLESGRVSTVEAVASLLYELEGDDAMYRGLLDNLKIKVDACRLQKNRSLVYDTHEPEERSARHRWRGAARGEAGGEQVEGEEAGAAERGEVVQGGEDPQSSSDSGIGEGN